MITMWQRVEPNKKWQLAEEEEMDWHMVKAHEPLSGEWHAAIKGAAVEEEKEEEDLKKIEN